MPSILGEQVNQWEGRLYLAEIDSETTQRGGLDGSGKVYDAWRAPSCSITTRTIVSASGLGQAINRYRRLTTKTGTCVDGTGVNWDNCQIERVRLEWDMQLDGSYLLTAYWLILPESTRPS